MYHRNIFGSSSKVFGNLRKSSDISGNFRKFWENVRKRSSGLRNNFGKSSEIFGKWSEIYGKSSKTPSSACLYNKKNITRRLEDMNFIFSWQKHRGYYMTARGYEFYLRMLNSISHSFAALTSEISSRKREEKFHIHKRACNILFII